MKHIAKELIRLTTPILLIAAALAACAPPPAPTDSQAAVDRINQEAQACASSIETSAPESPLLTEACRRSQPALTVLSTAQEKYANLEQLTADLTTKIETYETTSDELFEAHREITGHTAGRIRSNLETQATLERSSEELAATAADTVTSRIEISSQLEQTWLDRYTDLETRYSGVLDSLAAKGAELLDTQLALDEERAEFDRILQTAISEGTREHRAELTKLQQDAQALNTSAQEAITQAAAAMTEAHTLIALNDVLRLELDLKLRSLSLQQNSASPGCEHAWTALKNTHAASPSPQELDRAWAALQSSCAPVR